VAGPPDHLGLIFEPFAQVDESLQRKYGGTGVGLAFAKDLVELTGGRIECESTPGQGTTFRFTLEFGKANEGHWVKSSPATGAG